MKSFKMKNFKPLYKIGDEIGEISADYKIASEGKLIGN